MKCTKTISSAWLEQYWLSLYHLQCSKKAACVGSAELKLRLEQAAQLEKYGLFLSTCFIDIFFLFLEARFGVYECAKEVPLHRQKCPHTGDITNSPVLCLPSVIKLLF